MLLLSCGTEPTPWSASDVCPDAPGTLHDERDGQDYKTVKIGTQTWMAENLNYATGTSWCYGDAESNCAVYGRLYNWETARIACPTGWHIPSDDEWLTLVDNMGGSADAGIRLKSSTGWKADGVNSGDGTNDCSYSALPGGVFHVTDYDFINVRTYWWADGDVSDTQIKLWGLNYDVNNVITSYGYKKEGHSLRCVLD